MPATTITLSLPYDLLVKFDSVVGPGNRSAGVAKLLREFLERRGVEAHPSWSPPVRELPPGAAAVLLRAYDEFDEPPTMAALISRVGTFGMASKTARDRLVNTMFNLGAKPEGNGPARVWVFDDWWDGGRERRFALVGLGPPPPKERPAEPVPELSDEEKMKLLAELERENAAAWEATRGEYARQVEDASRASAGAASARIAERERAGGGASGAASGADFEPVEL